MMTIVKYNIDDKHEQVGILGAQAFGVGLPPVCWGKIT
jgi:hypothetical protein